MVEGDYLAVGEEVVAGVPAQDLDQLGVGAVQLLAGARYEPNLAGVAGR